MRPRRTPKRTKPARRVSRRSKPVSAKKNSLHKLNSQFVHLSEAEGFLGGYAQHWKAIFDNSQDGILIADIATKRLVRANKMISKMLGYSEKEILSMSVKDLHPLKGMERSLAGFERLSKGQATAVTNIPMKRKDGSFFYADISCSRLELSGRKYLVGFFRDVSERKASEEALTESEEMFRTLTERSPNMIFINQGGRVVYANPMCVKIMGYSHKEFYSPQFNFLDLMHPDDIAVVRRNFLMHQKGKEVPPYEYKMLTKDGRLIYGILTSKLIHYRGAPAILGMITDISDRKKAEEKIHEVQLQYRKLVDNAKDGVLTVSPEGRFVFTNHAYRSMTGYTEKELCRLNILDTYPDHQRKIGLQRMKRIKRGEVLRFQRPMKRKDGSVIFVDISAWRGPHGNMQAFIHDVTQQMKSAEALRQSEENYKHMIETTGTGYVALDARGCVIDANREYLRLTGRKKLDEILGHKVEEWTAPHDRERNRREVKKCFKSGFVRNLEIDYRTPAGTIIPVEINATVIRDGGPVRILTICRDISERKRAESILAQREAHLSAIIENQPGMVWLKDTQSRFLIVNQEFADATRVNDPKKMTGKTDFNFWPRELAQRYRADDERVMKARKSIMVEEPILDRGVRKWYETFKTPVVNEEGRILGTTGYARDITERKRTEATLLESEEKLRAMFETSPSGMALCEMDGTLVQVNQAYLDIIGYTEEEALKLTYWDLTPKEYAAAEAAQLRSMARTGRYGPYEKEYMRKNGERIPVLLNGAIVRGVDGKKRIWSVVFDITERKQTEEALKQSLSLQRATLESTGDGILVVDNDQKISDFNERFRKIWRIPKKILTARDDKKLLRSALKQVEEPARFLARIRWYYAHPRRSGFDIVKLKDGRILERETHTQWLGKKPVGRVWSFRDVTERKKSEVLLQKTVQEWHSTFDAVGDAIWLLGLDGRILRTNKAAVRMFGKNAAHILGRCCCEVVHRSKAPPPGCPLCRMRKSLHRETWETSFSNRWYRITCDPVLDARKTLTGIVHIITDITDRKRADEAVLKATRFNESIISSLPGIFYVFDQRGKFVKVNEAFETVTRYSRNEVIEKMTPLDFFDREDKKKVRARIAEVFTKGESSVEAGLISKEGKKTPFYFTGIRVQIDGTPLVIGVGLDITERKKAEDALYESQQMLQLVLDTIPQRVFWKDRHSVYLGCNKPFAKDCGYAQPKGLIGKTDYETASAVLADLYRRDDQKVMKTGRSKLNFEEPQIKQDGSQAWLKTNKIPLRNRDGKVMGVLGTYEDITAHKKAESALRESEFWLKESQRVSHIGSYELDISTGLWKCSETLDDIFGIPGTFKKNVKGWERILHPDHREMMLAYFRSEVLGRKKTFNREYKIRRIKDGKTRWVLGRGSLTFDSEGKTLTMIGTIQDITERKRVEAIIEESRRQLRQIIDTVPHMIFAKDKEGRFLLVNRAVAQAYGKEPRDIIGVRRQDLHKVREEVDSYLKVDQEILATGEPRVNPGEVFTDSQGRKHILQTIKIPFRMVGAEEDCILGVSVDVTEQKKVEDFRNEIVRTVSHELRTPLSIQKEGISLLMDEMVGSVNDAQKEILSAVMRSIDRLARMISNLLDVSSIETRKVKFFQKMVNLEDLLKDVVLEFKKRAVEKKIDLSMKPWEHPVRVFVDPDKITQVLSNLVDNAIKFTPEGGSVGISLSVSKNEVECEVRDTGIGITPENLRKAFEKFQQFSRMDGPGEKGFGLGLSIAKGIIELHGGRIWIESEFGKGTRVTFSLPFDPGKAS